MPATDADLIEVREVVLKHGTLDIELVGMDGNAFYIMGALAQQARRQGWPQASWHRVRDVMKAGDYDHLLRAAMIATGDLP